MIFKHLSALLLIGLTTLSFADDIVGKDDRRSLTHAERDSYSFVGRLHVKTLTRWQGWQDIPRCTVTLISEKIAITDATCFISTSLIAREEVEKLKTKDDFTAHFIKHSKDYSVVFSNPKYKRISIRSIQFSDNFNPGQVSRKPEQFSHIFFITPPVGNPLLILDLETLPDIKPIEPFRWTNDKTLKDEVKLSAVSHARDNETLVIDDNCVTSDNFEDASGFKNGNVFHNSCDDVSLAGSPVVLTSPEGERLLRGINFSGNHLDDIREKNPNFNQYELWDAEDKGCGEISSKCVNLGISGNSIDDSLNKFLPTALFLDKMSAAMETDCAARITFNHIVKRSSLPELFSLCSRDEMLSLEKSDKAPLSVLKQMAQTEKSILNGGTIPENFSVNDAFYKEILDKKSLNIFQKLHAKSLLSEDQQLAFMKESPETLSEQLTLFGNDDFRKKLNTLAKKLSPLFADSAFWSFVTENKFPINEIKNLSLDNLVERHGVDYKTLKNFYSVEEFKKHFSYRELINQVRMSHKELISSGVNYRDYVYNFSAAILRDNGGDLSKFKSSGISIYDLTRGSFTAKEISTGGFSLSEVISATSVRDARKVGYELKNFREANLRINQIEEAFTVQEIRAVYSLVELSLKDISIERLMTFYKMTTAEGLKNFSIEILYPSYSIKELMGAGSTLKDIRALYCHKNSGPCTDERPYYGWTTSAFLSELGSTSSTAADLDQAGFSPMDIFHTRDNLKEVRSLNRPIPEYYKNGFTVIQLVDMGFTKKEIKKVLKTNGYKIKNSEFKNR